MLDRVIWFETKTLFSMKTFEQPPNIVPEYIAAAYLLLGVEVNSDSPFLSVKTT